MIRSKIMLMFFLMAMSCGVNAEQRSDPKVTFGKFGSVNLGTWITEPGVDLRLEVKNEKLLLINRSDPKQGYAEFGKPMAIFRLINEKQPAVLLGGHSFQLLGSIQIGDDIEPIVLVLHRTSN